MWERKIFEEIPGGKNVFHSAILSSYSFNFHHFEHQVLRTFKRKWITSINVLIDENILSDSLGLTTANLKALSKTYAVSGISSKGVFHPKINFFIGDNRLLVLFGSGNITAGGHGKNHEIFSGFFADEQKQIQLPIILEIWNYILSISETLEGYSKERITRVLTGTCKLLSNSVNPKHVFHNLSESFDVALVYNDETSIFNQITNLVPSNSIDNILIVCPYYDKNGATLELLAKNFNNAAIDVFLQKENGLPPIEIPKNKNISFYDFDFTERGKTEISGKVNYDRKLHSKIIYFESKKEKFCLIGSTNVTSQAFGSSTEKTLNCEFGALYKSKDFDFIKELGLSNKKVPISVNTLSRSNIIKGDVNAAPNKFTFKLKALDLNGLNLKIFLNKRISNSESYIMGFGLNDQICFKHQLPLNQDLIYSIKLNALDLMSEPQYCALANKENNIVSNKLPINYLEKLQNTNPSHGNRSIRQILSSIEGNSFNEFEIAEFLNSLETDRIERIKNYKINRNSKKAVIEESDDGSGLTYEEAVKMASVSADPFKILSTNPTTRIWQGLENLFNTTTVAISEEQMDEEELGEASISRDRNVEELEDKKIIEIPNRNKAHTYLGSIKKMIKNYCEELIRLSGSKEHQIDTIDYHKFLLVSFIINKVCFFTNYEFPKIAESKKEKESKKENEPDRIDRLEWQQSLNELFYSSTLVILKEFAMLHLKSKIKEYSEEKPDELSKQKDARSKTLYYLILNATLLNNRKHENVMLNWTCLRILNLFKKCGVPDSNLNNYIDSLLKTFNSSVISSLQATRMCNYLVSKFSDAESDYAWTVMHGFCKILGKKNKSVKIDSLHGIYLISEANILKS